MAEELAVERRKLKYGTRDRLYTAGLSEWISRDVCDMVSDYILPMRQILDLETHTAGGLLCQAVTRYQIKGCEPWLFLRIELVDRNIINPLLCVMFGLNDVQEQMRLYHCNLPDCILDLPYVVWKIWIKDGYLEHMIPPSPTPVSTSYSPHSFMYLQYSSNLKITIL